MPYDRSLFDLTWEDLDRVYPPKEGASMPKRKFPHDRSVAFTILLDVDPNYRDSVADNGESVTAFLAAWYLDPSLDMYEFGQRYAALNPTPANTKGTK